MDVVLLCSVHKAISGEPNFTLLLAVMTKLNYLSMLFILLLAPLSAVQASSRINNMLRQANFYKNLNSELKLGSYDGTWCAKRNGATFATIPQILIEQGNFSICHVDI